MNAMREFAIDTNRTRNVYWKGAEASSDDPESAEDRRERNAEANHRHLRFFEGSTRSSVRVTYTTQSGGTGSGGMVGLTR